MKIHWNDIGSANAPGEYTIHDQCILVQKSDIDVWNDRPDAVFDVVDARFKDGGIGHVLNDAGDSDMAGAQIDG